MRRAIITPAGTVQIALSKLNSLHSSWPGSSGRTMTSGVICNANFTERLRRSEKTSSLALCVRQCRAGFPTRRERPEFDPRMIAEI